MARDAVMAPAFSDTIPPLQRIEQFFGIIADFEAANRKSGGVVLGCPFGNIAAEVGTSEPSIARRADTAFRGMASFLRDAFAEAKARGELGETTNVAEAADAAVAYFEGLSLLAKARNDPSLLHRLGPRVIQLANERPATSRKKRQSRTSVR